MMGSEYREAKRRLRKLPRDQRAEVLQSVVAGRAVSDRRLAGLARDYAHGSRTTYMRILPALPLLAFAIAIGALRIAEPSEEIRTHLVIAGFAALAGAVVGLLRHRKTIARFDRAIHLNGALDRADDREGPSTQLRTERSAAARDRIPGLSLAWVSWGFWILLLVVRAIQQGLSAWFLWPLSLAALAAWGLYTNPRKTLGWLSGVLALALGSGGIGDLIPPLRASFVITGVISLCAAIAATAAFFKSRLIRREWRRQEIELGADPPMLRRAWCWYRDRPVWAQVGLAILIIPPALFIGSALLVGVFEGITEGG